MSWLDQLNETIESTSSALKTSRVSSSKPNTSFTSFRTPLTVTEVQNTPSSTRQAWNENTQQTQCHVVLKELRQLLSLVVRLATCLGQ